MPPAIDLPDTDQLPARPGLARCLLAELLGSAFLAALVIGSGIAAQTLSPSDVGLQLFENAAATAAGLYTIILMFGPVSGGHFNPVVSLADATFGGIRWRHAFAYIPAQITGCVLGAVAANGMFSLTAISISTHHRASGAHLFSEAIATAGLLLVIFSLARSKRANTAPAAVGAYIGAAMRCPPPPRPPITSTQRLSRSCKSSASTYPIAGLSYSRARWPSKQRLSSRWAAVTPAPTSPASATSTGTSPIPRDAPSLR